MAKIVYNACYGGFCLSEAALMRYAEIKGLTLYPEGSRLAPEDQRTGILRDADWQRASQKARERSNERYRELVLYDAYLDREDPVLVQVVEELGDAANGMCAKLAVYEIPDGTAYRIDEYDGNESVITQCMQDWRIAGSKKSS